MPALKTYDLFLSHVWQRTHNSEYYRLVNLLISQPSFNQLRCKHLANVVSEWPSAIYLSRALPRLPSAGCNAPSPANCHGK